MALVNLKEINSYVRNLLDQVDVQGLKTTHAERVREWFVSNMSNIGRYAHRNQEKFGTRNPSVNEDNIQGRQDGWQAVTEEVPHLDHITYGTGILYINGEMEVPRYEDVGGNHIQNDEFCHVDRTGEVHHFSVDVAEAKTTFNETQNGSDATQGYKWNFGTETSTGDDESSTWRYDSIISGVVNILAPSYNKNWQAGTASTHTPGIRSTFNDAEVYHIDNERNHYPYIIVNSATPTSINNMLQDLQGENGMHDNALPDIAGLTETYPPVQRIEITEEGAAAILDFISPISETPFYVYTETQINDNYEPSTDAGKGGSAGSQSGKVSNVKAPSAPRPDYVGDAQEEAQRELDNAKAEKEKEKAASKAGGTSSKNSDTSAEGMIRDLTPTQVSDLQVKYNITKVDLQEGFSYIMQQLEDGYMFLQPGHLTDPKYTLEGRRRLGLPTPGADDEIERKRRARDRLSAIADQLEE